MNFVALRKIGSIEHPPAMVVLLDIKANYKFILAWCCWWIAMGVLYIVHTPSTYTAAATVLLEPRRTVQLSMNPNASNYPPTLDSAQADSQIQVIKSEQLLRYVFETAGIAQYQELKPAPPGQVARARNELQRIFNSEFQAGPKNVVDFSEEIFQSFSNRVASRRLGQSYAIEVSYSSTNPNTAASIANSIAMAFIGQQVAVRAAAAEAGAEYLQNRISSFRAQIDSALKGVREGAVQNVQFPDADARIIGAAIAPTSRAAPVASIIIFAAFAFSVLSALIFLSVRSSLSPFLRYRRSVTDMTGTECVAFPPVRKLKNRTFSRSSVSKKLGATSLNDRFRSTYCLDVDEFTAPLKAIAAGLMSSPEGRGQARLGVCSWDRTAGRAEIAFNLAALLAPIGGGALFVDASTDEGRSADPDLCGANGLADVLSGRATLTEATRQTEFENLFVLDSAGASDSVEHAFFVPAGRWKRLLDSCSTERSIVVDLGSLKSVPENIGAIAALDDLILVVEAGKTRTEDLRELCSRLKDLDLKSFNVAFFSTF